MDFIVPQNFIKLEQFRQNINFEKEVNHFLKALDNSQKEQDIQSYIKENAKWFIPGAIIDNYDFSSNDCFIVPEQKLGAEYQADYLLLGNNSIGHQIILVEFENVNVEYKQKNANQESKAVRNGLTQINDWIRWLDNNRKYFLEENCKLKTIASSIPSWGIHYCLVVSRRKYMDDVANKMRAQTQSNYMNLKIITYDRIVDLLKRKAKTLVEFN